MTSHQLPVILAVNSGSSSLKFGLFEREGQGRQLITGKISGIGTAETIFSITDDTKQQQVFHHRDVHSIEKAVALIIQWLEKAARQYSIMGVGHRVVQGGLQYQAPQSINALFLENLTKLIPMAPLHLPDAITIIKAFVAAFPAVSQIACFDTAFHQDMPFEAKHLALPRAWWQEGIIRYGFHGLSCRHIMDCLQAAGPAPASRKIIIAHLGSGCSITAIKGGHSVETTMGFTPAGGLLMNTRPGDVDPGMLLYLLNEKKLTAGELSHIINHESGLKAVAGNNNTVTELLLQEASNEKARQAITMFCYQAKKHLGALIAVLGGLDTLVFTGGIGEHEPRIRERICSGMEFAGIELSQSLNEQAAAIISKPGSPVAVHIIAANEEIVIAREVAKALQQHQPKNTTA